MFHSRYYGVNIYRYRTAGYRLPWQGGSMAADTLAGLKALIRNTLS